MKKEKQLVKKKVSFKDPRKRSRRVMVQRIILSFVIGLIAGVITFLFNKDIKTIILVSLITFAAIFFYVYFRVKLNISNRIKKMENVFPDFLQLMSSNLRAGITVDRSMLLSAREEFDPLDKEILKTGRDITTGKSIHDALLSMSKRIGSEKISKTILLLLSGIRSGGDVATLLEETASHMREKEILEKRAASNVLMYVIFIFLAVAIGAPALFGLSNILVEILYNLLGTLPAVDASVSTPFTLSSLNITPSFVYYFSIIFLFAINVMASLTLGLVSKGEEKEGLKYLLPMIGISYAVFFLIKFALSGFVSSFFS